MSYLRGLDRNYNSSLIIGARAQRKWQKPSTLLTQDLPRNSMNEKESNILDRSTKYNKFVDIIFSSE